MFPDGKEIDFKYEGDYEELPLSTVMNFLLFEQSQSLQFDANFISKYSPELHRFQYFIERLAGISIENEDNPYAGKQWVASINLQKHEWDLICEKELSVKPSDAISFHFELVSK